MRSASSNTTISSFARIWLGTWGAWGPFHNLVVLQSKSSEACWHMVSPWALQSPKVGFFSSVEGDIHGKGYTTLKYFADLMPLFISHQQVQAMGQPNRAPVARWLWCKACYMRNSAGRTCCKVHYGYLKSEHQQRIGGGRQAKAKCSRAAVLLNKQTDEVVPGEWRWESVGWWLLGVLGFMSQMAPGPYDREVQETDSPTRHAARGRYLPSGCGIRMQVWHKSLLHRKKPQSFLKWFPTQSMLCCMFVPWSHKICVQFRGCQKHADIEPGSGAHHDSSRFRTHRPWILTAWSSVMMWPTLLAPAHLLDIPAFGPLVWHRHWV